MIEKGEWHETVSQVLNELQKRYPSVPLLAMGQTIFWDEPTKAVLLWMMQAFGVEHPMIFAVHDTDYFAKMPGGAKGAISGGGQGGEPLFRLLPHNEGSTRGLWSAAGEISSLFGSETIPTRSHYIAAGVPFEKVAHFYPGGREALLEQMTEAWGWRGLVYTADNPVVVPELPLRLVLPALEELLQWGFENTLACVAEPDRLAKAREWVHRILEAIRESGRQHAEGSLSDLYRYLLKVFLEWLFGSCPPYVTLDCASHLLQFNPQTASLPRFQLVHHFLAPETRALCEEAYNQAVAGSDIYPLDRFGAGALPFDLVIPGRGRGTLHLTERYLRVQTPNPIFVRLKEPIRSVEDLAAVVESELGAEVALVGKALTLILMLAHEFLFVMNERGSPYIPRCIRLARLLREQGIGLKPYPILRLHLATWDALEVVCFTLKLPEHLSATFGVSEICSSEFARRWRLVVQQQRALLQELSTTTRLRDLLLLLKNQFGGRWADALVEYDRLQHELQLFHQQAEQIQAEVRATYQQVKQLKAEYASVEREKGDHFRTHLLPLRQQLWDLYARGIRDGEPVARILQAMQRYEPDRQAFEERLKTIRMQIRQGSERLSELNQRRLTLEHSEPMRHLRQRLRQIEREAELTRLHLVRNAILTAEGLVQTHARPAAWWFLLLDPDRTWFRETARRSQLRFEELSG